LSGILCLIWVKESLKQEP